MRLFSVLILVLAFIPQTALAKQVKVVVLETMPVPVVLKHSDVIAQNLTESAQTHGWDLELEILKAQGNKNRATQLLSDSLKKQRPDIVITLATLASEAAREVLSGTDIPQLFAVVADPVGSGLIKKEGAPSGTNISGVVYTQQRNTKLEMVLRILEHNSGEHTLENESVCFGVVSSDYPSSQGDLNYFQQISSIYDSIEFCSLAFPYEPVPEGLPVMLDRLEEGARKLAPRVDYFWEVPGPLGETEAATKVLLNADKPLILGNTSRAVELGALLAVITDYDATGEQIVRMAEKIFSGHDVAEMSVQVPTKFQLYINLKTAERLDLGIPSHILMIAQDNLTR